MNDVWPHWPTAITEITEGGIAVRGYQIQDLMGEIAFSDAIYLTFTGELPTEAVGALIDAILVASLDHGTTSPSAITARTVVSGGAPITTGAAAGLLSMHRYHGAAIEPCMEILEDVVASMEANATDMTAAAATVVADWRSRGERLPGFGHRVHASDPRTARLFALASAAELDGRYQNAAEEVARALSDLRGKPTPINLDGAIAALLCAIGFPPELANPLFTLGRFVGLNAQAYEEKTRMRPMRRQAPDFAVYDGPPGRSVKT